LAKIGNGSVLFVRIFTLPRLKKNFKLVIVNMAELSEQRTDEGQVIWLKVLHTCGIRGFEKGIEGDIRYMVPGSILTL
jgi:hypothetical protein